LAGNLCTSDGCDKSTLNGRWYAYRVEWDGEGLALLRMSRKQTNDGRVFRERSQHNFIGPRHREKRFGRLHRELDYVHAAAFARHGNSQHVHAAQHPDLGDAGDVDETMQDRRLV